MSFPSCLRSDARVLLVAAVTSLALLPGCTTRAADGASPAASTPSFAIDQEVSLEGRVASADMTPWTYDGNAIVVVDSAPHGSVKVQLPARWNLCRATGIDTASTLKPGDRVRVVGTATDPDTLTVCDGATHRIQRL